MARMVEALSRVPRSSMWNERRWQPSELVYESVRGGKRVSDRGCSIKSRIQEEVMECSSTVKPLV